MLLPTAYLAPIPYYSLLLRSADVRVEASEHYPKQTLRNRCLIATAGGVQALTVPVARPDNPKALTRDIRISDHGRWRHLHWQALVSAYGMSPFFEYYADDFAPFYERRYTFLIDFNLALQSLVCELLDIRPTVGLTASYAPPGSVADDLREAFTPRAPRPVHPDLPPVRPYYQVFGLRHGFLPDLSIVDLLFNMGNESVLYL